MQKLLIMMIAAVAATPLPASVFTSGPVTISGRIEFYEPGKDPATVLLYLEDITTSLDIPKAIDINEDGTFSRTFTLAAPQICAFGDYVPEIYIEPNSDLTLTIHTDGETFGGSLGEVNTQLRNAPRAPRVFAHYNTGKTPQEQKEWVYNTLMPWEAKLAEYMATLPSHSLARRILSSKPAALRAEGILDIAFDKDYDNTQVDAEFYADAFRGLFRADTLAYVHGSPLLNRLAYNRFIPFEQMEIYPQTVLGNIDFLRERGAEFPESNLEKALRACTDSVYYAPFMSLMLNVHVMYEAAEKKGIVDDYTEFSQGQGVAGRMLEDEESQAIRLALLKRLTQTDTIPIIWQIAMTSRAINLTKQEDVDRMLAREITDPELQGAVRRAYHSVDDVSVWDLPDTKGGRIMRKIMEPYRGKHVLVDFWGLGCGPCRAGIQNSQEFRRKCRDNQDFTFLFISDENEGSQERYDKYVAEHMEGNDHLRLSADDMAHLRELFEFNGIPHYRIFDPSGRVVDFPGDRDYYGFREYLQKLDILE